MVQWMIDPTAVYLSFLSTELSLLFQLIVLGCLLEQSPIQSIR